MILSKKQITSAWVILLLFVTAFAFLLTAKANPSFFVRSQLSSATTTPTYMTAGTATTTITLDTGVNTPQGADGIALLVQFAASSTAATLNADVQYSQDGVDWYASTLSTPLDVTATSSPTIAPVQTLSFIFASSTINRSVVTNANSATSTRIVKLYSPTRYVRAVFYLATGSTNGAFWAEFVGKRQAN